MKRKLLSDSEKLYILKRLADIPRPSQEVVAEETHHRKTKIEDVLNKFKEMDWEKAKAFCGNDKHILALREDYLDKRIAEEKEARIKAEVAAVKQEEELKEQLQILAGGNYYLEEETGRIKSFEGIKTISDDGRLLA